MSDDEWRQALSMRGFIAAKVSDRLTKAAGKRIELGAPNRQPYRRNFAKIVNAVAARHFGVGNYRMESLGDPSRIAVWEAPGVSGIVAGTGMARRTIAQVREWQARRL